MSIEDYRKAGKIASTVVEELKKKAKPGMTLLEIAEYGESRIKELGGKPAFPINLSMNEVGAHYTPPPHDTSVLESELLKIDIGVHVNGYIADTAFTLDFTGNYSDMVKAAEKALAAALKLAIPGTNVREIGMAIEETIKSFGYRPIANLSGHLLGQYNLHAGINIPNIPTGDALLEDGMVFAIEPFATDGAGKVVDSPDSLIFRFREDKPTRLREAKQILQAAKERFDSLPFAMRWVKMTPIKLRLALNQLVQANALYSYPILIEQNRGVVTQAEHTVIVGEKPEVTTHLS